MSKAQAKKMEALEIKLLASIGVSNPYWLILLEMCSVIKMFYAMS
jgi:hypothetical protein